MLRLLYLAAVAVAVGGSIRLRRLQKYPFALGIEGGPSLDQLEAQSAMPAQEICGHRQQGQDVAGDNLPPAQRRHHRLIEQGYKADEENLKNCEQQKHSQGQK